MKLRKLAQESIRRFELKHKRTVRSNAEMEAELDRRDNEQAELIARMNAEDVRIFNARLTDWDKGWLLKARIYG